MLTFQIVSDIHLEFNSEFNINKKSNIIILLGDISACGPKTEFEKYKTLIVKLSSKFSYVLVVTGNHEYYNLNNHKPYTMGEINKFINDFIKPLKNVYFLNNKSFLLKKDGIKYRFVGTTLWSYIPETIQKDISKLMNDYVSIYVEPNQLLTPKHVTEMHMNNLKYIKCTIKKALVQNEKVILLTHHKPYRSLNIPHRITNYAYENDLIDIICKPIVCWCYGHTHKYDNTVINGVKIYSNPRGYPYQRTGFDPNLTITI